MIDVVGLGDDGWTGISRRAQQVVERARVLVGGARQLSLVPDEVAPEAQRRAWPSPLKPALHDFITGLGADVVVLASGDPLRSGIATTLIATFGAGNVRVHPTVSSDALARARMGWSAESVDVVTLVGRSPQRLRPFLTPGARLVVLCSDGTGPGTVARMVCAAGAGAARLSAWWHLGGAVEGSLTTTAEDWPNEPTPDLVVMCVQLPEVLDDAGQRGPAPGRPEESFDHDGLITKRDLRASALARLRPILGGVLWDLGAGSGAVGLEWTLAARRARVVAVEQDAHRAERLRENARSLGVEEFVELRTTSTVQAVEDPSMPTPDAVFLGGGLSAQVIDRAYDRLVPGGRLVGHAVTVESERLLLDAAARWGGDVIRMSVEHMESLGRFTGWRPARAVVSWSVVKPTTGDVRGTGGQADAETHGAASKEQGSARP